MKIPIENVYYLLCYAWNKLEEKDLLKIDPRGATSLVDLFAKVLIGGINHLIKRGYDRNYVTYSEETRQIRGKLNFAPIIKRNLLQKGFAHCDFDELSYNVLHNQILKTTLRNLTKAAGLDPRLKDQLTVLYHRFPEVDEIALTQRSFNRVQLHRNNFFYEFLLRICELLHTNLLPSESSGSWIFRDFLQDDKKMPFLFEEFVRNFYKIEAQGFRVGREEIYWKLESADLDATKLLPDLRTDVTLTRGNKKFIVECKYTAEIFQEYYGTPKLRSEHLNQLNAYLTNLPEDPLNDCCHGILLYPSAGGELSKEYTDKKGRKVSVRTLNLNQDWKAIHRDLLAMVA